MLFLTLAPLPHLGLFTQMTLDGYSAPLTAGNFLINVQEGLYNGRWVRMARWLVRCGLIGPQHGLGNGRKVGIRWALCLLDPSHAQHDDHLPINKPKAPRWPEFRPTMLPCPALPVGHPKGAPSQRDSSDRAGLTQLHQEAHPPGDSAAGAV